MKVFKVLFFILVSVSFLSSSSNPDTSIHIKFTNVRNNNGKIQIQVYKDQATFAKETPWKVYYADKEGVKDKTLSYRIDNLPEGTYGIAILDDENNNKKMDWSFIMLPKEGFGFSNYFLSALRKPKFDDFKFYLKGEISVSVKVKYV